MIISSYCLPFALVGLTLLDRRCLAQVTQSFRWAFADTVRRCLPDHYHDARSLIVPAYSLSSPLLKNARK